VARGAVLTSAHRLVGRRHNLVLLAMIDELLEERRDLSALAFGCGPGSFTGVRIAASVAQGIALALGTPVVPVSTLATIAAGALRMHADAQSVIVCIGARKGEVYTCAFRRAPEGEAIPQAVTAEHVMRIDAFAPERGLGATLVCGDAVADLGERLGAAELTAIEWPHPHAEDLVRIARMRLNAGEGVDVARALPVYLEGSGAWQKLAGR
jgi:tRNA threonylcarbamoyladenosine biosynthesis protein TsaB